MYRGIIGDYSIFLRGTIALGLMPERVKRRFGRGCEWNMLGSSRFEET